VIEVFSNTWSYSTLGLVYDPSRGYVRYAHESQSSAHTPTVYDLNLVTRAIPFSVALSTQNTGWPWQLDNRTGAGYDASTDTYFLPDYNGDLANADDNIVEVNHAGTIINAWEMDDEVGSNDSSDGSEIDSILDIAVAPGSPTRYFATAAYDGNVVYEIALQKTGTWWTPNSWHTVMTCTVPGLTDTLGIDYDAVNGVLYHSDWHSERIVVTDLACNVQRTFTCPSSSGYNSGVTYVEGSQPPEVWVTNFTDDETTRCEAGGATPTPPEWGKWIDDIPWDPHTVHTVETFDILRVVDVLTATEPISLVERWDHQHLRVVNFNVDPTVGAIVTGVGSLRVELPPFPQVVTVTKFYQVRPSTWPSTTLYETLWVNGSVHEERPVVMEKRPPALFLNSTYDAGVLPGTIATYTLGYENAGGYENDVVLSSTYPITAPFVHAAPPPAQIGPNGRWARWTLGDLAAGAVGTIEVFVEVPPPAVPSQTIGVRNEILNHLGEVAGDAFVEYHVEEPPPVEWQWEKLVNGAPWDPDVAVTLETSDTVQVVDMVSTPEDFTLLEFWDDEHLWLTSVEVSTGTPVDVPGGMKWEVPAGAPTPAVITKTFHVEPCTWLGTVLWEELWVRGMEVAQRPVPVEKVPSELWIESEYGGEIYPATEATFILRYGNAGGYENQAWITNTFPAEAPFVAADPGPDAVGPQGLWARWDLGALARDDVGTIEVTVEVAPGLPPSTTVPIYDYIYDHAGIERGWTEIAFHVRPPEWEKRVNGEPWHPDLVVTAQTSDTFEVVDVITGDFASNLVEFWNPAHLELVEAVPSAGHVISADGNLEWIIPREAPDRVELLKRFHVRRCAWTHTPLHEELWVEGQLWQARPFAIHKRPAQLWVENEYDPLVFAGEHPTFTLRYGNHGGYESFAWVTTTFPTEAPFVASAPPPAAQDPGGRWARWDVGPLAEGDEGSLTVEVAISDALSPGQLAHVHTYAYDHVDIERSWKVITYEVRPVEPLWEKEVWINGAGPYPPDEGPFIVLNGDSVTVVDRVSVAAGSAVSYTLTEEWGDVLALKGWSVTGGSVMTHTHSLAWQGWGIAPHARHLLTKTFEVAWGDAQAESLTERLVVDDADPRELPAVVLDFESQGAIYLPLVLRGFSSSR
jgi:hypothetical protein